MQYKGKDFDDKFYRDVLSMHVNDFLRLIQKMESDVSLTAQWKMHTAPHINNELCEVMRICREHDLHQHHTSHDLGFHSSDHFADGVAQLSAIGKVDELIAKTMDEWNNVYATRDMPVQWMLRCICISLLYTRMAVCRLISVAL